MSNIKQKSSKKLYIRILQNKKVHMNNILDNRT